MGLAALLVFGPSSLPAIIFGTFFVNLYMGSPMSVALVSCIGTSISALLCVYLLRKLIGFRINLDRVRDVAGLALLAALLGSTFTATWETVFRALLGQTTWEGITRTWLLWWVANAISTLVVAPVILAWSCPDSTFLQIKKNIIEASICAVLCC
ncbi:MAG TPA: hypothetical protein EYQ50_04695 [Verrucomicrobiales bacterium]|nr:hypothetical protein [Verrucomicrobiales bacterium]